MTTKRLSRLLIVLLVVPCALAGCVMPGPLDQQVVNHYQQALANRGPQGRVSDGKLGLLVPAASTGMPGLSIEPIVPRKTHTETVVSYRDTGKVTPDGNRELDVTTVINTTQTTFERYADGKQTPLRERKEARTEKSTEYIRADFPAPAETKTVTDTEDRVGRESWARSVVAESSTMIHLTLEDAVQRTLANSLEIRVVSYDPAMSREDTIAAAAEFDWTVFGGVSHQTNHNEVDPASGQPREARITQYQAGIKEKTITGATQSLAWTMTRTWDNSVFRSFDPWWQQQAIYQIDQPLLRDAWPEFNLAKLHIAQINEKISSAQFRQKVDDTVTQMIINYWQLIQARRDLEIQEALLVNTKETYYYIKERQPIDASKVQIKQAEAAVQSRQAVLIRAKKTIQDVQDQLVRELSDKQINLLGVYEISPDTQPTTAEISLNVADQMLAGLQNNPVLEQTRLGIDSAAINVIIAKNQELPKFNIQGSAGEQGLRKTPGRAGDDMLSNDYASFSLEGVFEYTIGMRAARAETAKQRYGYLKSITQMQDIADQVAMAVKERVRQVQTTHDELVAQQAAVEAAAAQLQALEDTQQIRGRLTPEFLQVKLQAQSTLADAERAQSLAVSDYNAAMIGLARATGTVLQMQRVNIVLPAVIRQNGYPTEADVARLTSTSGTSSNPASALAPPIDVKITDFNRTTNTATDKSTMDSTSDKPATDNAPNGNSSAPASKTSE